MTIHFTSRGIYADTEEERRIFYDKICAGDPVIWGHIQLHNSKLKCLEDNEKSKENSND